MIIKVQTDTLQDRFLVDATHINWVYPPDADHIILEAYLQGSRLKRVGDMVLREDSIQAEPSLQLRVYDGDTVYIMNDEGKTIDSKHIIIRCRARPKTKGSRIQAQRRWGSSRG